MSLPPEIATALAAMVPVTELRGAIPLGIQVFNLPPFTAFIAGVIGNIIPNFLILRFLGPVSLFLRRHSKFFDHFFHRLFAKTRRQHSKKFVEYGAIFLVLFVAVPFPGSGSWTGALIAFLFGVAYWRAIGLISLGVLISGILVTVGWESIINLFELLT